MDMPLQGSKVDIELSKVVSFEKRQELYNIIHSEDPSHYERIWLAGFLKYIGYSLEEILDIIDSEACWSDYDPMMTYCQVASVFRSTDRHPGEPAKFKETCPVKDGHNRLARCVKENPCSDSVDGYCFLSSGVYNLSSTSEKNRRALNCFMDHQIAKFQRQKRSA